MAERLIDAEALKERIEDNCCANCDNCGGVLCSCCKVDDVFCVIEDAPTIEEKPVVHAHWDKLCPEKGVLAGATCSNCKVCAGYWDETMEEFDYCPFCGAQMDEGVKIPVISMEDVPKLAKEMEK